MNCSIYYGWMGASSGKGTNNTASTTALETRFLFSSSSFSPPPLPPPPPPLPLHIILSDISIHSNRFSTNSVDCALILLLLLLLWRRIWFDFMPQRFQSPEGIAFIQLVVNRFDCGLVMKFPSRSEAGTKIFQSTGSNWFGYSALIRRK